MFEFSGLPLVLPCAFWVVFIFLFSVLLVFLPLPIFGRSSFSSRHKIEKDVFLINYCPNFLLWVYLRLLQIRLALLQIFLTLGASRANLLCVALIFVFLPPVWFIHSYIGGTCVCSIDLVPI